MGDIADSIIDSMWDDEYEWQHFQDHDHRECDYCGAKRLRWVMTANGWRMQNKAGQVHSCEQYRAAKKGAK